MTSQLITKKCRARTQDPGSVSSSIALSKQVKHHLTGKKTRSFQYGRKTVHQDNQIIAQPDCYPISSRFLNQPVKLPWSKKVSLKTGTTDAIYICCVVTYWKTPKEALPVLQCLFDRMTGKLICHALGKHHTVPDAHGFQRARLNYPTVIQRVKFRYGRCIKTTSCIYPYSSRKCPFAILLCTCHGRCHTGRIQHNLRFFCI